MANPKNQSADALSKIETRWSFAERCWGLLREYWPIILSLIGGSSLMSYLASITEWASKVGPFGWAMMGVAAMTLFSIAFYVFAAAAQIMDIRRYVKEKIQASGVNTLSPNHENEKINLVDFYHPFYKPVKHVRFSNCDLMGPASIYILGGSFIGVGFIDCEVVIVREDRPVKGVIALDGCTLLNCRLYRATLLMNAVEYAALKDRLAGITVISDGRIGDV